MQIELPPRARGSSPLWWDWEGGLVPHTEALIAGLGAAAASWSDTSAPVTGTGTAGSIGADRPIACCVAGRSLVRRALSGFVLWRFALLNTKYEVKALPP